MTGPQEGKPVELGSRRQLLFDPLFLAESEGVALTVETPSQDPAPVLTADRPWEDRGIGPFNTVMLENGAFRMWYDAMAAGEGRNSHRALCHAESVDGIHWDKRETGLIEFRGSGRNNIVAPSRMAGATVFRDDQAPAAERYKLWTKYYASEEDGKQGIRTGLWGMVSPDGFRWKRADEGYPLWRGNAADTQSFCFRDEDLGKYVGFVRIKKRPEGRQRTCSAGVMFSDDFRTWTMAREVFKADETDESSPVPNGEPDWRPTVDFYTPGGMKVPGVPGAYILLPTAYHHWQEDAFPSTIDIRLATSRDGINWWQHPGREPFLRLGADGSASSGMIFANPWPIPVGDELWIYYGGVGRDHREELRDPSLSGVFRARIRRDGFVSVRGGYGGGEFTTPAVTFSGARLEVNMDGSAGGWLQVELQSIDGRPLRSHRLDRCDTIRGNSVAKVITWNGSSELPEVKDQPVRLRFVMRSMKLFAFQFAE